MHLQRYAATKEAGVAKCAWKQKQSAAQEKGAGSPISLRLRDETAQKTAENTTCKHTEGERK